MIVIEEDNPDCKIEHVQLQPQHQEVLEEMSESSCLLLPPPAYSSGSFRPNYSHDALLQYPEGLHTYSPEHLPQTENALKRFFKAFVIAVGTLLLLAVLLEGLDVQLVRHRESSKKGSRPEQSPGSHSDDRIRTARCIEGGQGVPKASVASNDPFFEATMSFSLPASVDLAFFSNDSYSSGNFNIEYAESSGSEVEVDVTVSYRTPKMLRRSKVCLLEEGSEWIVGVMTVNGSVDPPSAELLRYFISVRLPASDSGLLYMSRLQAHFMLFAIDVNDLSGRVHFDEINLVTAYNYIQVKGLTAHKARLQTAHADIIGNFTTSSSLELTTKNAAINVDVSMHNAGIEAHPPTALIMNNENSAIFANLNLTSPEHIPGGNFSVKALTKNANILIDVLEQPIASYLAFSARSSNAVTQAKLPPQFSGSFSLRSTILRPVLEILELPEDDRTAEYWRHVEVTRERRNSVEGYVSWVDEHGKIVNGGGFVDLKTDFLPAILTL